MANIFVFGSNLAGRHGAGSAKEALKNWGAIYGQGHGRQGNSYAIPTKDQNLTVLPLNVIKMYIIVFLNHAKLSSDDTFYVVKIGCGLAGYSEKQIKPMFKDAPNNVELPPGWRSV